MTTQTSIKAKFDSNQNKLKKLDRLLEDCKYALLGEDPRACVELVQVKSATIDKMKQLENEQRYLAREYKKFI